MSPTKRTFGEYDAVVIARSGVVINGYHYAYDDSLEEVLDEVIGRVHTRTRNARGDYEALNRDPSFAKRSGSLMISLTAFRSNPATVLRSIGLIS